MCIECGWVRYGKQQVIKYFTFFFLEHKKVQKGDKFDNFINNLWPDMCAFDVHI